MLVAKKNSFIYVTGTIIFSNEQERLLILIVSGPRHLFRNDSYQLFYVHMRRLFEGGAYSTK